MYDFIQSVHKALGIESTRVFVLIVALGAALVAGSVGAVFAWIVDVGYKNSPEYKAEHPPKQQAATTTDLSAQVVAAPITTKTTDMKGEQENRREPRQTKTSRVCILLRHSSPRNHL